MTIDANSVSSALAVLGASGWVATTLAPVPSVVSAIGGYQQSITPLPSILLSDNFNGTTIDTTNRWVTPVTAGTGTMTQATGGLIATTGTTASNAAAITSIETFEPNIGNLVGGTLLSIEAAPGLNTNRCFGFYTRPGSFTAATPVQDGYVWEFDITGTFGASIYSGGTRVFRQVFPINGATFLPVSISYQGLNVQFFINDFTRPAITIPLLQPSTLNLPLGFHCINHTSVPAAAPTWSMSGAAALDNSGALDTYFNGQTLSRVRLPSVFIPLNAVSIASEATIWTPASGKRFRLMGFVLESGTVGGNVLLKDNTGGTLKLVIPFGAAGSVIQSVPMGNGILSAAANNVLTATGGATQTLSGYVYGTEE
jgi:hypothetical protein